MVKSAISSECLGWVRIAPLPNVAKDSLIASQQHGMGWRAMQHKLLVILVLIVHRHLRYRYNHISVSSHQCQS